MRIILAVALLMVLPLVGYASIINRTSQTIPNDPSLAFVATAGAQALANCLIVKLGVTQRDPIMGKWYIQIPLNAAICYGTGYFLQYNFGALQTKENDENKANWSAVGGGLTTAAMCVGGSWNFGLGGCR